MSIDLDLNHSKEGFTLRIKEQLPSSGLTCIYGQSGSGKTTLLRCIAGLEKASNSFVSFKQNTWQDLGSFTPTHKRKIGFVFQEGSLFSHLSAKGNLDFAIKRSAQKNVFSLDHIIQLLGIEHLLSRFPSELSGGERQRIAIARALLTNPKLLLMDEPLSSLDYARKQDILPYLESIKRELKIPILYVSHSSSEVTRLADHLLVLKDGEAIANGELTEVLSSISPAIKLDNDVGAIIKGKVESYDEQWSLVKVSIGNQHLYFGSDTPCTEDLTRLRILARDVSLSQKKQKDSSILNSLPATVIDIQNDNYSGNKLVKLAIGDQNIIARISALSCNNLDIKSGNQLWANIKSVALIH